MVIIGALVVAPVALSAQINGIVRDEAGRPLDGAVVDLWAPSVRIAQVITATDGGFHFRVSEGAVRLVVRRIGARAVVKVLNPGDSLLQVVLKPAAVDLTALRVDGNACTAREDAEAGRMWERAAAQYAPKPDTLWYSAFFRMAAERVSADLAGRVQSDSIGWGWTASGGKWAWWFPSFVRRIEQEGYAIPDPEGLDFSRVFFGAKDHWWVTPEFRRQVRLSRFDESTIRFCPRRRTKPWVEGEIVLAEDGSLLRVRWRYGSPGFQPATGGETLFIAPTPESPMQLLPSSDILWQERPSGMVAQRMFEYREWKVTNYEPQGARGQ